MAAISERADRSKTETPNSAHVYQLLVRRFQSWPDAIVVGSQQGLLWKTLTGHEFLSAVASVAHELEERGVRSGDRVVVWLPSTWRTPVYLFALWKLGAVVVPFDREMNPLAGAQILELVEPRLVLGGYGEQPAWLGTVELTEWSEPSPGDRPDSAWDQPSEELAAIFFTSGTTGNPKGCLITHVGLCSQVAVLRDSIPINATSRLASILPLSHLFELTCGLLFPIAAGAAIHYVPSRRGPDILRVLQEQRVTHMIAVPQFLTLMAQPLEAQLKAKVPQAVLQRMYKVADGIPMPARRKLFWPVHHRLGGHLQIIAAGGAALPYRVQRLWERLGVRIVIGYGASECSPIITCSSPDGTTPPGSVGRPIAGVQVRPSSDGELEVKGPNVMRGYFKDPERTAEVLREDWYSTGDIGTIDAEGNITLTGRAKDLIVLPSGLNVWPSDIEDALRNDPAVRDAAVIAVPTKAGRATLHAYLIPQSVKDRGVNATAIAARANKELALHQRVATASWWPESDFPRTNTLKVRRHMLAPPESAPAETAAAALAEDAVIEAVAAASHQKTVRDEQTLAELGIDSLGLVELALAIEEKTGIAIDESELAADMTVEQLRGVLAGAHGQDGPARSAHSREVPMWPYTFGRSLRFLSLPLDAVYQRLITRTIVVGAKHVEELPERVIFAGTHHSFADLPLVRFGLGQTAARRYTRRLVVATAAEGFATGLVGGWAITAFGLFPLERTGDPDVSLRRLVQIAQKGNAIVIFPQGLHADPARERAGDPAVGFKAGVSRLAEALDAAVVPFGLANTEKAIPPDLHGVKPWQVPSRLSRVPLAIAFGQALTPENGKDALTFIHRLQEVCFALTRQAEEVVMAG